MNRLLVTAVLIAASSPALGEETDNRAKSLPNIAAPTTGGLQLWGDVAFLHQWRIQRHVSTGHYRLLSADNVRHAWGSREACEERLAEIQKRDSLPPMRGEAVLLLHGLSRSRRHMRQLEVYLTDEGFQVFNVVYPSRRAGVEQHAEQLAGVIDSLAGVQRVHFVAHSLGNLVVRRWMKTHAEDESPSVAIGRFVMLGPPNHRPAMANLLGPLDIGKIVAGPSGHDLSGDWNKLEANMVTPPCEFGILAGGKNDDKGWNPMIPGDDDMLVGVAEARLIGACDYRLVDVVHRLMPDVESIHHLTLAFLKHGRFGAESERQPITTETDTWPERPGI